MLARRDINEQSVSYITATFFSKNGQPVTPVSAQYRLDDITKGVKCAREVLGWTAVEIGSTSHEFTITDQQNSIINRCHASERKQLTVEVVGSDGFAFRDVYDWQVVNLAGTD